MEAVDCRSAVVLGDLGRSGAPTKITLSHLEWHFKTNKVHRALQLLH